MIIFSFEQERIVTATEKTVKNERAEREENTIITSVEIVSGDHFFASLDKASNHIQSSHATVDSKGPLG